MAKVVCKNCGHKNPSSAAVCENCGSFMFEDPKPAGSGSAPSAPQNIEQEAEQATVPENSLPQPVDQAPRQAPETIRVAGSGILQQMSTFVGFIILGVFFILEYNGYLSNMYYFLIFFVLILAVPTLMRTATSVVKFNGQNFTFRGSANSGSYDIKDVENITIDQYNKQNVLNDNCKYCACHIEYLELQHPVKESQCPGSVYSLVPGGPELIYGEFHCHPGKEGRSNRQEVTQTGHVKKHIGREFHKEESHESRECIFLGPVEILLHNSPYNSICLSTSHL